MHAERSPELGGLLEVLLVVAVVALISLGTGLRGGASIFCECIVGSKVGGPFVESWLEDLEVLALFDGTFFLLPPILGLPFL